MLAQLDLTRAQPFLQSLFFRLPYKRDEKAKSQEQGRRVLYAICRTSQIRGFGGDTFGRGVGESSEGVYVGAISYSAVAFELVSDRDNLDSVYVLSMTSRGGKVGAIR